MRDSLRKHRVGILLLVLAMALAGCRGDGGDGDGAAGDGEDTAPVDTTEEGEVEGVNFDIGVTDDPCPNAVNDDNGCIYLGTISDLTVGPFAPLGGPITDAQEAFWQRVNEEGGIAGFDIDVTTYVRDNEYNPEIHNQVYQEIKNDVLALAQTLGSPTTAAIVDDMEASNIVGAPAGWTSLWDFTDVIIESGTNYCLEAMNQVDYFVEQNGGVESVIAVGLPGDYGEDGGAGARIAAEANGAEFTWVEQTPLAAGGTTTEAVEAIVGQEPDMVSLFLPPRETAEIVGGAAARGYQGQFIGAGPSWNPALLESPAAEAMIGLYLFSGYWGPFGADTEGHNAMREAVGDVTANEGYTVGWVWSYPLRQALQDAAEAGDLTREGLLAVINEMTTVDYEGMLPEDAGNYAGEPNETVFRQSVITQPNPEIDGGAEMIQDFFSGPTAEDFELTGPCYQVEEL
jgi:ABC-type branched-subunit amino acid transport system substrate-binding protein